MPTSASTQASGRSSATSAASRSDKSTSSGGIWQYGTRRTMSPLLRRRKNQCMQAPQGRDEEREMRRQIEEEELKKELYAKHETKRMAVIDERKRRHLKITDVVIDDTAEAEAALPELTKDMETYDEKEREMRRQIEEEELKKELYAKHETKRMAVIDERRRRHLKITDVVIDDTAEAEAALPELTKDMEKKIMNALTPNPPGEALVEGFGQMITRRDIHTLNDLNWLNDEVINFCMNLIIERGKEDNLLVCMHSTPSTESWSPKGIAHLGVGQKKWTYSTTTCF